jgi:hypothetical protein
MTLYFYTANMGRPPRKTQGARPCHSLIFQALLCGRSPVSS